VLDLEARDFLVLEQNFGQELKQFRDVPLLIVEL
jgi:hypothetical protein